MRIFSVSSAIVFSSVIVASPALAGTVTPGAPGPIAGLGIPALALLAYGYKKVRGRRNDEG